MFTPSERTRKKHKTKVDAMLAPDRSTDIAYGNRALEMNAQAWAVIGAVVVMVLVGFAVFDTILIPGFIFFAVFMNVSRPPRIIAVTPAQFVVISRSSWTSSPKAIVLVQPRFPLPAGSKELALTQEKLKFKAREGLRIADASTTSLVPQPMTPEFVTPGPLAPVQSIPRPAGPTH